MSRDAANRNRPPGTSPAAIRAHYDAGNTFFAAWLDARLSYSAGRWRGGGRIVGTLEEAQLQKLDWHLRAAGVGAGSRLLDVGCGWGSLLTRAVTGYDASIAVGLTPATEQNTWITEHLPNARVRTLSTIWQRAAIEAPFDAIVSIGALEHFARPDLSPDEKCRTYSDFFAFCSRNLVPQGRVSLHFIGWMDVAPEKESQNLPALLFPDSNLPRMHEVLAACDRRFHIMRLENVPDGYAPTLRVWLSRLSAKHEVLVAAHGKRPVRDRIRAFRLFILGFETGTFGLYRLSLLHRERGHQEAGPECRRDT